MIEPLVKFFSSFPKLRLALKGHFWSGMGAVASEMVATLPTTKLQPSIADIGQALGRHFDKS